MLRKTGPGGNLFGVACTRCRCPGNFTPHGSYRRHLVVVGKAIRLTVRRVRCASCGATHAILPEGVVPYRAYSEGFVLAVLAAWASGHSNSQVRAMFGISESTRRRILSNTRRRICALLACGASRPAVDAALRAAGIGAVPAMHMASLGTRLAENVRLRNVQPAPGIRGRPST